MKIKLYLDGRRATAESTVFVRVTVKKNTVLMATGVRVAVNQWDATNCKVIGHVRRNAYNSYLQNVRARVESTLLDYSLQHDLTALSKDALRRLVQSAAHDNVAEAEEPEQEGPMFAKWYVQVMETKAKRTRQLYQATYNRMKEYDKNLEQRTFEDINKKWLTGLDVYLMPQSPSKNARAIHFRNIRAVFNDAIDDEAITCYPFRKFKIKTEPTKKRALTVEQLRRLIACYTTCEDYQRKYIDIFMLSFFLVGINMVDLLRLKHVVNGHVDYKRAKTGRLYSIKVETEAAEIIERYRGTNYLLNFTANPTDEAVHNFVRRMDEGLKKIGDMRREGRGGKKIIQPYFPELTSYWARHTWATIAASLDIPKETIAHALGHASAFSSVTDVYIDFDMRKVDEANRRVMDFVLYGK